MDVYVASKFSNKVEVKRVQDLLRSAGHEITYDWTNDDQIDVAGPCDSYKIPVNLKVARDLARQDYLGVRAAHAVIFLPVEEGGRGCYTEMGFAIAWKIPVIVVGPYFNSIFMYLPGVVRVNDTPEKIVANLDALVAAARGELT